MPAAQDPTQLRRQVRQARRQLTRFALAQAQTAICRQVFALKQIQSARHIGIYLDAFGEVPTHSLILELFKRHKQVYIPRICPMNQHLGWQRISLQQYVNRRFAVHHLGMQQAMQHRAQPYSRLDSVLMPLVVFDLAGQRIGMGGGFYDRTLSSDRSVQRIGLAYPFQCSPQRLQQQPWDQRLDVVCTPQRSYRFKR
jgi:5-formyltetrahydrofolate cyclo-ligase